MKKLLYIILIVIALGAAALLWHWDKYESGYYHPQLSDIKDEVGQSNPYYVTSYPEDYKELTQKEYDANIVFPVKKAVSAKLHCTGLFAASHNLSANEMAKLLEILNDSANYRWGELGTPEVHYYFTFHDSEDNSIGLTTIDREGQSYSQPSLARMKWGSLKRMDEVLALIKEIKD